jgi:hypothetical protein
MSALLFALAIMTQAADPAPEPAPSAAAADEPAPLPYPVGAPHEDYQLVAWCYGALGGYLDLHDTVMPEVTRIETTFRRPGSNLAEDLKVYADMQAEGRRNMKLFARAMTAAEKASMRPINAAGAAAIRRGRSVWAAAATVPKARVAQEWMSWSLPVRCTPTAETLEKRALLAGASLQVNVEPEAEPAPVEASPADAPARAPTIDDFLAAPPAAPAAPAETTETAPAQ